MFDSDSRTRLPRSLDDLALSIGLIASTRERTLCTGFCVGGRTVATAAHCLFRTAGERRPELASFRFEVGREQSRATAMINGRADAMHRQHVVAGNVSLSVSPPIDATGDWALIRLDQPICQGHGLLVDNATPSQIKKFATRGRLMNVAFSGTVEAWHLTVSPNCRTAQLAGSAKKQVVRDFSATSGLVLHECDTGPASSGSPLLALGSDRVLKVVGMNVGTYQQTRYLVTEGAVKRRYKPATVSNTALSGSVFADHVLAFTRADIIADRPTIVRLQAGLNAAGFDAGPVDGIYGDRGRAAVLAFEKATGRAPIGLVTRQLLGALERFEMRR